MALCTFNSDLNDQIQSQPFAIQKQREKAKRGMYCDRYNKTGFRQVSKIIIKVWMNDCLKIKDKYNYKNLTN